MEWRVDSSVSKWCGRASNGNGPGSGALERPPLRLFMLRKLVGMSICQLAGSIFRPPFLTN
ncbi:hypothetical protein J6590_017493 [Homalodisca vitripennis]|nr:hypothetical protein J6590_017493 [Homalodisca vitripennis]